MNRTKIILGATALILTAAGAFAKMHRSTAANLYYTTSSASPVSSHCKLLASAPGIPQFTTGAGSNQAKILTNGGLASRLIFATAACGTTRKVYFKP